MCIERMLSSVDSYSCVVADQKTIHIALPLELTENTVSGIRTILDSWKNQYVPSLDGVLLSYRKVTFKNKLGRIIYDQPCVHYDVKAEFSVFRPSVGVILRGTINRISREHVGCVVHDCINVSIYHVTNFGTEMSEVIKIGKTVLFKVTKLEILRKTLRIHGGITRACYRLMMGELANGEVKEEVPELNGETADSNVDGSLIHGEEMEPSEGEFLMMDVVTKETAEEEGQVDSYVKVSKSKKKKGMKRIECTAAVEPSEEEVSSMHVVTKVEKETSGEEEGQTNLYVKGSKSKKKKEPKRKEPSEEMEPSEEEVDSVNVFTQVEKATSGEEEGQTNLYVRGSKSKKKKEPKRREHSKNMEPSEEEVDSVNVVVKVEKETSGEEEGQVNSYVKVSKNEKKKRLKRKERSVEMEPSEEEVDSRNIVIKVEKVTSGEEEEHMNSYVKVNKSKKKKGLKRKEHGEEMEPSEQQVDSINVTKVEKETSGEEESQTNSYIKVSKSKRRKV